MGFFHLGSNLRDFRKIRGLSQQGLALRAGPPFSQTYVSRLERGLCCNGRAACGMSAHFPGATLD
jgi:predicted transcriptional regulator